MADNFWKKLERPIYALAPLAGVTDSAFRRICKAEGADVVYSEMASVTALAYSSDKTMDLIAFVPEERPYVVQLFGSDPEHFAKAARLIEEAIHPDGFDVNFGCPAPKVIKQGAGSALMQDLGRSHAVLEALISSTSLPVSIKIRAAAKQVGALQFLERMSPLDIKAIMIHGRTLAQGFQGPIDMPLVREARQYCRGVLLVNGGLDTPDDITKALKETGADGVGIARGALGNPWIFNRPAISQKPSWKEVMETAISQARMSYEQKGKSGILEMRQHLCWYVKDIPGARQLREKLVRVESLDDIKAIFHEFKG
jgi:nifR3 family TIM-barrel protein